MKKISNWVFGSFFRTMGRFFFFLFFGFLLATILSKSEIKWTDLLGIDTVSALTYTTDVKPVGSSMFNITNSNDFTCYDDYCDYEIQTTDSNTTTYKDIGISGLNTTTFDFVSFNFVMSNNVQTGGVQNGLTPICSEWQVSGSYYYCSNITNIASGTGVVQQNSVQSLSVAFKIYYSDNDIGYCTLENNKAICPTYNKQISMIRIIVNQKSRWTSYIAVRIFRVVEKLNYNTNTQAIENQTQTIIQNQENQTQQILEGQENATQQQIESQQVCKHIDISDIKDNNKYLTSSGNIGDDENYGITDYINVINAKVTATGTISQSRYICFYNTNKTVISCINYRDMTIGQELTIPNGTTYIRCSLNKLYNQPQFDVCQNGNQALQNSIDNTDTSEASSEANNFFESFTSQDNGGISSIITAPLSAISGLASATCTPITLPIPYLDNKELVLPCMSAIYTEHFGTFFSLYQTIIFGVIAYRMLVSIFMMIQGFKNPDDDKIEVVDL